MENNQLYYDIAIVADGNATIGMGHIMRTSSIADALKDMGYKVCYIASDAQSETVVQKIGYTSFCLDSDYRTLFSQKEKIGEIIQSKRIKFVFFDSYFLSNDFFESFSEVCNVGCFGFRDKYSCGMQLIVSYGASSDYKWYEDSFRGKSITVLLGPAYVPLRKQFWNGISSTANKPEQRILITNGATDSHNISCELVKSIRECEIREPIDLVVGGFFDKAHVKKICSRYDDVFIHEDLTDLSNLMTKTSLAISAGGMTLYELMASGVPTIAYAIADNQLGNCVLDGPIAWCGDIRCNNGLENGTVARIVSTVNLMLHDDTVCLNMVNQGRKICDGQGSIRVANAIVGLFKHE